jgi:hypothetical protein
MATTVVVMMIAILTTTCLRPFLVFKPHSGQRPSRSWNATLHRLQRVVLTKVAMKKECPAPHGRASAFFRCR